MLYLSTNLVILSQALAAEVFHSINAGFARGTSFRKINGKEKKDMPRRKSSIQKKRADKTKHLHNLKIKQDLKKVLKKFHSLLSAKKLDEAKAFLSKVYSKLDKAAKKGIIHRNTAGRKKARLTRRISKAT